MRPSTAMTPSPPPCPSIKGEEAFAEYMSVTSVQAFCFHRYTVACLPVPSSLAMVKLRDEVSEREWWLQFELEAPEAAPTKNRLHSKRALRLVFRPRKEGRTLNVLFELVFRVAYGHPGYTKKLMIHILHREHQYSIVCDCTSHYYWRSYPDHGHSICGETLNQLEYPRIHPDLARIRRLRSLEDNWDTL